MQKFYSIIGCLLLCIWSNLNIWAQVNPNHIYVEGHYRSNGTYVQPHYRTAPNSTNQDNFSTLGNTNPYTGQAGSITPDSKSIYQSNNLDPIDRSISDQPNPAYLPPAIAPYQPSISLEEVPLRPIGGYKPNTYSPSGVSENHYSKNNNEIYFHDQYTFQEKLNLEKWLKYFGYNVGEVDGLFDEWTIIAIRKFQKDNRLPVDGRLGTASLKKIKQLTN